MFNHKKTLRNHISVCINSSIYKCEHCDVTFKELHRLHRHVKSCNIVQLNEDNIFQIANDLQLSDRKVLKVTDNINQDKKV